MASRKVRDKARKLAAHLLEVSEEDLEWEPGKFFVKGAPSKSDGQLFRLLECLSP